MKAVIWQDTRTGKLHRSYIRDTDPDSFAPKGVPGDPPDVFSLNWETLMTELHNELVNRGLFTSDDLQRSSGALTGAILSVFRTHLIHLYRKD